MKQTKKRLLTVLGCACLAVLSACGVGGESPELQPPAAEPGQTITCRVIAVEDGQLLLAQLGEETSGVYRLNVDGLPIRNESGETAKPEILQAGQVVDIAYDGSVLETYPAQLANPAGVSVCAQGFDNLAGLYLQVLEDLWSIDEGLNGESIYLGLDLSRAPGGLTEAEKAAIGWRFAELHGKTLVTGTYGELVEQGYIDGENLCWEDGVLFTIGAEEKDGALGLSTIQFDAEKWRGGLGAYFFTDCTAVQSQSGGWDEYTVGSEAIA